LTSVLSYYAVRCFRKKIRPAIAAKTRMTAPAAIQIHKSLVVLVSFLTGTFVGIFVGLRLGGFSAVNCLSVATICGVTGPDGVFTVLPTSGSDCTVGDTGVAVEVLLDCVEVVCSEDFGWDCGAGSGVGVGVGVDAGSGVGDGDGVVSVDDAVVTEYPIFCNQAV